MARVNKTLLRRGIYEAPQGTLRAGQSRLSSWVDKFHAMKAAGIKVPCSWGHQPDAVPGDTNDRARKQYWLSAFNAGYLDGLTLTPDGKLDGKLDCPGVELDGDKLVHWVRLPDGRQVKSAIGEVSIAVKDHTDGTGKKWADAIVHVALTPLPVAHGTGGFSLSACTGEGGGFTLSLTQMTHTLSASEEDDDVADDDKSKKTDDDKPAAEKKGDDKPEGGEGKADHFKECLEVLKGLGLSLPEDTTEQNFMERVCVAGHALQHASETTPDADLDDEVPPPEEEPEAEYSGEEEAPAGNGEQAIEEQRPMMMSLANAKTASEKKLIAREQESHKRRLNKRLDALQKRGIKPDKIDKLREQVSGYTLSLDEDMAPVPKQVDLLLSALEDMAPAKHPLKGSLSRAVERRHPGPAPRDDVKAQEAAGDEIAALAGAPVRQK